MQIGLNKNVDPDQTLQNTASGQCIAVKPENSVDPDQNALDTSSCNKMDSFE